MNKSFLYLFAMLIVIVVTCFLQWQFCCGVCPNCVASDKVTDKKAAKTTPIPVKEDTKVAESYTKNPFIIRDEDGDFEININDNFNFKNSSQTFEKPVSADVEKSIDKLKAYLSENENKVINISGFYKEDEKNTSMFPNLGLARANVIKNYMVEKGIHSHAINTQGVLKGDLSADDDSTYYGPVGFAMMTNSKDKQEDYSKLLSTIKADPLIVYFQTKQIEINFSDQQKQKIANIAKYLDKVETSTCLVVGHTDNIGVPEKNKALGLKRAEFLKAFLVKNGIPENKIEAISKGQEEPLESNDTEEGRTKNRRTVVTIK